MWNRFHTREGPLAQFAPQPRGVGRDAVALQQAGRMEVPAPQKLRGGGVVQVEPHSNEQPGAPFFNQYPAHLAVVEEQVVRPFDPQPQAHCLEGLDQHQPGQQRGQIAQGGGQARPVPGRVHIPGGETQGRLSCPRPAHWLTARTESKGRRQCEPIRFQATSRLEEHSPQSTTEAGGSTAAERHHRPPARSQNAPSGSQGPSEATVSQCSWRARISGDVLPAPDSSRPEKIRREPCGAPLVRLWLTCARTPARTG